jgi:hypothetical protein
MKNKTKHRRRPAVRQKVDAPIGASTLRSKPVSVRSVSGLTYPLRGKLGRELAEERS